MRKSKSGNTGIVAARVLEMLIAGEIPSVLLAWIIIFKSENAVWNAAVIAVFIAFAVINCIMLKEYIRSVSAVNIHLLNVTANILYGIFAAAAAKCFGTTIFSALFANMYMFKPFGMSAEKSIMAAAAFSTLITEVFIAIERRHGSQHITGI